MDLKTLKSFDARWTTRIQAHPFPTALNIILKGFAHSGDTGVILPCLLLLWFLGGVEMHRLTIILAAVFLLAGIAVMIVKYTARRKRPAVTKYCLR